MKKSCNNCHHYREGYCQLFSGECIKVVVKGDSPPDYMSKEESLKLRQK